MAIDLERTIDRVIRMAEDSQKAKGIDSFGSVGYKNALERDKAAAQRSARDQQLLDAEKLKATERMTTRGQDVEEAKAEATLANANAVAQAKNQNALQVAAIRANGGLGRKDPSVMTAHEETQAAIEWAKANAGMPGKPGMTIDEARAAIRPKAAPSINPDGTVATTTATPQELVPGHKNPSLGESMRVPAGQLSITTPKGEAPSALSANQWQQYADSKSPGMKYEGNQPGMIGDQIARFKRPDGSAFFANTGAAKMQMGDALTPAATPNAPLDNTPGAASRATMPDAANRSAMNTAKAQPAKSANYTASSESGLNGAGWNALSVPSIIKNTNWTDATLGAGMTRDEGKPVTPAPVTPAPVTPAPPELQDNLTGQGLKDRPTEFGPVGYLNKLNGFKSSRTMPRGFLDWLGSLNKRKTSTNPLFPNYAQE